MSFTDFWNLYPRKVSRKMAEKAWSRLSAVDQQAALEALPNHIRYWEQAGTAKEYILHASTFLNQARWEDEIEMPQPKQQQATLAWWTTDALIMAKGAEIGLTPRPGETMGMFKSRISDKMRAAA